ncbi:adenosylmethionine--8-amino-7-oxononanoate transaminase [Hydrocarboniphaga sp.]|uniref:adenosylmethionine--8-amino-7-oxononanoate transaminase n=1 Tax=Hydrocarboniphaga sp. TaxID=2033016 RepID=UPI003D131AB6
MKTEAQTHNELVQRSLASVWHPCTQMKDHEWLPMVPIASAEGVWLTDTDGKRYLDAVSSWWTNIFGHRHPVIVKRLKEQLDTLDHVIFAGFTHEPAVKLAEKLCELTQLDRCFYADNGSAAVEVALKMSSHYWRNTGKPQKTRFIALSNGYHGETLGALAVGDTGLYRDSYKPLLMQPVFVQSPDCFERGAGTSWEDHSRRAFAHMEFALEQHAHETAAVIVEPLVQCAGGMRMYHPIYLTMLREACTRHGVHLIVDEIATGFGRTGMLWASDWAKLDRESAQPIRGDFMCLSKGLTGGTLPLAAVMTTNTVYEAFYDDYGSYKAFLHSHSYTGNPLACAAALATLEIFESENWLARNREVGHLMWMRMSELLSHPHVAEVRQQGMILAVELMKNPGKKIAYPAEERRGLRVYRHGLEKGVLLRPLGNVVYLMPPYTIESKEVELMTKTAIEGIAIATRD